MKIGFSLFILTTSFLSPVSAADLLVQSRVDAVTVFPQGAQITRVTAIAVPSGDNSLVFDNLPVGLDAQSLRVEGSGGKDLEIVSVDSKLIQQSHAEMDARHVAFEAAIEKLNDERASLDQVIGDADYQRKLLLSLADKQLVPASSADTLKAIDAAQLGGLVDLVGSRLTAISKVIHDAQLRQREIDRAVADLQLKENALAPNDAAHYQVMVHVSAISASQNTFKLSYRVQDAGWLPFYDARIFLPEHGKPAALNLVRRAEVMQSTGESWDDVALTLSTARPLGSTSAPELGEDPIQIYQYDTLSARKNALVDSVAPAAPALGGESLSMDEGKLKKDEADKAETKTDRTDPLVQRQAEMQLAGFNANYIIEGRLTVDNSGTSKKVRIATDDFEAKLQAIAVPRLDLTAYLTAAFTTKEGAPILPGPVNLYRDGMFMGQGQLPLLSAGEEAKLGFGADDLIKVKRAEVKRNSGDEGLLTTSHVQVLAWDISVNNLHDFTMPVTVIDRSPFSTQTAITVAALPDATPATIEDYEKKRGVLAWNFDMEPKTAKTLKTGYRVTSPEAVDIGLNE